MRTTRFNKGGWRIGLIALIVWMALPAEGQQRVILGRNTGDKVQPGFFNQQNNASNTVLGLNLYSPLALSNTLVPTNLVGKTLTGGFLGGTNTINAGGILRVMTNGEIRLGSNAVLVMTNGAQWRDDSGARIGNWKATPDSNTVARYTDASNIVTGMSVSAGRWVTQTMLDTNQFSTNTTAVAVRDGVLVTNLSSYGRLRLLQALSLNAQLKTTNYTLGTNDYLIVVDATASNLVFTLPAASTTNWVYEFKRVDTANGNTVQLDGNGSELIDTATNYALATNGWVRVMSYGSKWLTLGK